MKILSYNIHRCNQKKIDTILAMNADIMVLPECATYNQINLPQDYLMKWIGSDNCLWKGLGVIWRNKHKLEIPNWCNSKHNYILPFIINNQFLLLAAWPTIVERVKKSYPQILLEALREYELYLSKYPTLICGDFNCYIGQGGVSKSTGTLEQIIEFLDIHGIYSLYHQNTGEQFGYETKATYYHQFKENQPFFIDYAFTNIQPCKYKLGEWDKDFSDHCPQMIELQ
ncbi:MAG: endonuclease/exonuclease/phosphatase family protein [Prevotella sp.]|nr:endonuclease/exonuclease/phosphatase family protein [Prevotella sp.]